jgi:hypothetical protein
VAPIQAKERIEYLQTGAAFTNPNGGGPSQAPCPGRTQSTAKKESSSSLSSHPEEQERGQGGGDFFFIFFLLVGPLLAPSGSESSDGKRSWRAAGGKGTRGTEEDGQM